MTMIEYTMPGTEINILSQIIGDKDRIKYFKGGRMDG